MVEFLYTTEPGGTWQAGRGDLFHGNVWSQTPGDLERRLEQRAEDFDGHNWSRRVSMLLDGGNVVPCAAVKLPNGRIFDAVLGRFDDQHRDSGPDVEREDLWGPPATGDAPSMRDRQLKKVQRKAHEQVAETRALAIEEAFEKLFAKGVINTPPSEIPFRPADYAGDLKEAMPREIRFLIETGRLSIVLQAGGVDTEFIERGWVCFEEGEREMGEVVEMPPERALSSWEIQVSSGSQDGADIDPPHDFSIARSFV